MNFRLAFSLGWGTVRARTALTVLAVILLSLGAAVAGGIWGTVYLLHDLQQEFLSALSVELELVSDSDAARATVTSRASTWPSVEFVQYITPDETLRDIQQETGEDLQSLFGANPFPAIVRVRFGRTTLRTVDSITAAARNWPEVAQIVYPRRLWSDADRFISRFQGGLGAGAAAFVILAALLAGLCIRAQVRNRTAVWEFLRLCGASARTLRLSVLIHSGLCGIIAGLGSCGLLYGLTATYGWLFLHEASLPIPLYLAAWFSALALSILAGMFSVRKV